VVEEVLSTKGTESNLERKAHEGIRSRLAALAARDYATADRIRAELLEQGIQLMDYKDEAGERRTRWEVKR
jgi:cysteinyl-tRNA synthetase